MGVGGGETLVIFRLVTLQLSQRHLREEWVRVRESERESVAPSWVRGGCTAEGWQSSPGRRTRPSLCTGSLRPTPTHSHTFHWKWRQEGKEWGDLEIFESSRINSTQRSEPRQSDLMEIWKSKHAPKWTFVLLGETQRWKRLISFSHSPLLPVSRTFQTKGSRTLAYLTA